MGVISDFLLDSKACKRDHRMWFAVVAKGSVVK
jgi:hypothetical protein